MRFAFETSPSIGTLATLGLIVLQPDETIEHDFRRLLPIDGVALYVSRIPSAPDVTGDTLAAMRNDLPGAVALLPRGLSFDAVGYGCTSGTSVIGADTVHALIDSKVTTKATTDPMTALIAACRHLGVDRLGFLSPYIPPVSEKLRRALEKQGIDTPVFGGFDEAQEATVARISDQSIINAARLLAAQGGIDALFMSCTNLRTLNVLAPLEREIGMPVLSSNLALAWHMAVSAGLEINRGFGALSPR